MSTYTQRMADEIAYEKALVRRTMMLIISLASNVLWGALYARDHWSELVALAAKYYDSYGSW